MKSKSSAWSINAAQSYNVLLFLDARMLVFMQIPKFRSYLWFLLCVFFCYTGGFNSNGFHFLYTNGTSIPNKYRISFSLIHYFLRGPSIFLLIEFALVTVLQHLSHRRKISIYFRWMCNVCHVYCHCVFIHFISFFLKRKNDKNYLTTFHFQRSCGSSSPNFPPHSILIVCCYVYYYTLCYSIIWQQSCPFLYCPSSTYRHQ